MRTCGINVFAGFITLLSVVAIARGELDMKAVDLIKGDDPAKRIEGAQMLCQMRQETVQALISILDGTFSAGAKEDAAKILGEYRAVEAVDPLLRNIEVQFRPRILKGLIQKADFHPISQALIKIGNPAIPAVLTRITQTDNQAVISECARVCLDIEGHDLAEIIVQKQIDKQDSAEAKSRLTQALNIIRTAK